MTTKEIAKESVKKSAASKTTVKKAPAKKETSEKKAGKTIMVERIGSSIGCNDRQRATLHGLGLYRMHQKRELEDTSSIRGMITKVGHLVRIVE